jgi:hypothetical protein
VVEIEHGPPVAVTVRVGGYVAEEGAIPAPAAQRSPRPGVPGSGLEVEEVVESLSAEVETPRRNSVPIQEAREPGDA